MILIWRLYEQEGILWKFMFEHIYLFDSSYIHIYSCLYARLLDLYNLWVNDNIDRGSPSLSFFVTLFFFAFFFLRCLYVSNETAMPATTIRVCIHRLSCIVTATTNDFLCRKWHIYIHSHIFRLISHIVVGRKRRKTVCTHAYMYRKHKKKELVA